MSDVLEELHEADRALRRLSDVLAHKSHYQPVDKARSALLDAHFEIRRLRALTEWQDISTAPRDGTWVLLWLGHGYTGPRFAYWFAPWDAWLEERPEDLGDEQYGIGSAVPVYWRPITPPEDA